jgi:hypothetical protein
MRRQETRKIYLLQRPFVVLGEGPFYVMAYNRSRTEEYQLLLTPEIEELFEESLKIYVWGYIDPQGNLNIIKTVEKPDDWR